MDLPFKLGRLLMTRGEAIEQLMAVSFTKVEANQFLDEPDVGKRRAISDTVRKRVKEGK